MQIHKEADMNPMQSSGQGRQAGPLAPLSSYPCAAPALEAAARDRARQPHVREAGTLLLALRRGAHAGGGEVVADAVGGLPRERCYVGPKYTSWLMHSCGSTVTKG